ncbi:uncharacterized protein CG7065-like isoform X1 [Diorhabda sublineata]|uniref:uncharacterized protein CG7065-like isoform X1 n=2 Tax=Diorhabda sublineata TaxID=1163346 RepID=UPI0024E125DC|nr:uncharacterized protein CG7065-like isoform X1 [Diorhabda sublineata]
MEPCAPGTEDDPPIMYSSLTKKESEQQRLLSQKAFLKNGKYSNVFDLTIQNGSEHWYCNACECPVMGRVFQHELGRRHALSIFNTHHNVENLKNDTPPPETVVEVAPGEPIPPGFEDACRVSIIQERLDGFRFGPLVALEYLIELQDDDPSKEPYYLCILCDKRGDPRTVLTHLASYNHISQYLQKHFPTCWRLLAPYNTKQYRRNWQTTLQKIAEGIEKKFGRLKPYPIEKDKFQKDRMHYLKIVGKGRHFSEMSGYTFEELVVHDELTKNVDTPEEKQNEPSSSNNWGATTAYIEKPFKKRSPSPPVVNMPSKKTKGNAQTNPRKQEPAFSTVVQNQKPPIQNSKEGGAPQPNKVATQIVQKQPIRRRSLSSLSSLSDRSDNSDKANRRDLYASQRGGKPPDVQLSYGRRRSPRRRSIPRRRTPSPTRRRSPSPRRRSPIRRRSKSPSFKSEQEKEKMRKMEEYKKLARAIENDMFKTLKQHEKNPEKHPHYNEEWKKFWNRRYKELKNEGKDASKYDFKPEWIEFWNKRLVELHSDELRNRKEALRKRLALPEEINPIKFKIGAGTSMNVQKPLPMAALPDQDNDVIIIEDKDEERKVIWDDATKSRGDGSRKIKRRSPSPRLRISRERNLTKKNRSPVRYTRSRSRSRDYPIQSKKKLLNDKQRIKNASPISDISDSSRDSKSPSRERSYEKKRQIRESSFERDLRGKERIRTVADLPWERDSVYRNPYLPPPSMRDVVPILEDNDDDVEVNVVDVLRILTALEERLGSLGPKVVDLLAQALAMEKSEANSSEQLLDNEINCVLFETIKEKLKGQMFAGLVDHIQQRAFKKAIKKIASLIHLAGKRKGQREKLLPKLPTVTATGKVDKAAIAKQIANALILQGKTDVTQAELEQLINAVVGMAEASKVVSKPITTAGFLNMISGNEFGKKETKTIIDLDKITEPLTPSPGKTSISNMENLSDSDLQTLLQNFKDLSTEEQHNLINYLKKLEYQEPDRVEKLRKFVNLEPNSKTKDESIDSIKDCSNEGVEESKTRSKSSEKGSPFSNRFEDNLGNEELENVESDEEEETEKDNHNEAEPENDKSDKKVNVDSEEDEYTFEDVVKTVSKNVKEKEMEQNKKVVEETMKYDQNRSNLTNAKDLISQLMSNISKNNSTTTKNIDLLGLGQPASSNPPPTSTTTTMDLSRLLNINVASLASIVNNVKNMSANDNQSNFKPTMSNNQPTLNFDLGQLKSDFLKEGQNSGAIDRDHFDINRPLDVTNKKFHVGSNQNDGPRGPDINRIPLRGENDRFGSGVFDRFGQGGSDRFAPVGPDRFIPTEPDRFRPGGPDRFGPGGPDRFVPGSSDRFGPTPERFGPGGSDRFGPVGQDRFGSNRLGPGSLDRQGSALDFQRPGIPDRYGSGGNDRLGLGGPDRLGPVVPDRFGTGSDDRFKSGFGPGQDRAALGGPGRLGPGFDDRSFGNTGINRQPLNSLGAPGLNGPRMMGARQGGPGLGGAGNFGLGKGPFDGDAFNKNRSGPGNQRNFQRLPAPDFSKPSGNLNRW